MTFSTPKSQTKPQKPAPDECCGGGSCCPCVWDEYREKLRQWQSNNILEKTSDRF